MIKKIQVSCIACLLAMLVTNQAWAGGRPSESERSWFGQFSAGYLFPQGHLGDLLNQSFAISGGAIYWPSQWPVGININLGYSYPSFKGKAIDAINQQISQDPNNSGTISGGHVEMWKLTADAIWSLGQDKSTGFYLTGGGGAYYLNTKLESTGLVYYPPYCDPWYWWCVPGYVGPGTYVAKSHSNTVFGMEGGAGYSFRRGTMTQWFIEAKYSYIYTDRKHSETIPLEVGVRW